MFKINPSYLSTFIIVACTLFWSAAGCQDDDSSTAASETSNATSSSNSTTEDTGMANDATQAEDSTVSSEDTTASEDTNTTMQDTNSPPDDVTEDMTITEDTSTPEDTTVVEDTAVADSSPSEDTSTPEDTTIDPSDCAELCLARDSDSGFCTMEGYFGVDVCTDYCQAQSQGWDGTVWEAFILCAETDPLCFQTISQCLMFELYEDAINNDEPISQTAQVQGSGFEAFEGRWVFVEFSAGFGAATALDQTRVRDGNFALSWDFSEPIGFSGGVNVSLYIDVNENFSCDPEDDSVFGDATLTVFGTDPLTHTLDLDPSMMTELFIAESVCTNSF